MHIYRGRPWVRDELLILTAMAGRYSVAEIAPYLRRSESAIYNRLWRLRMSPSGWTQRRLARELGVSHTTVRRACAKAGFTRPGRARSWRLNPEQRRAVEMLVR